MQRKGNSKLSTSTVKDENEPRDMKLKRNSIYKRKKRKVHTGEGATMPGMKVATTLMDATTNVLLWLALANLLLLCDIGAQRSSIVKATAEQLEAPNKQRFLEEPKDTMVLVGQSAELACVMANKRGRRFWARDDVPFAEETSIERLYSRYSILETLASGQNSNSSGSKSSFAPNGAGNLELDEDDLPVVSNYTLHIENATLPSDDAVFSCGAANYDQQHRLITSRLARLTVLQPPTRLSVIQLNASDYELAAGGGAEYLDSFQATANDNRDIYATSADKPAKWPPAAPASTAMSDASQRVAGGADDMDASAGEQSEPTVQRIIVRQGGRLRLECRADQAKPHAELVWLDHQQLQVPKRSAAQSSPSSSLSTLAFNSTGAAQGDLRMNEDAYVEELVRFDSNNSKLSASFLVLSLKVQHHHANQVFTCVAKHPAFEQHLFPYLYGREPRRQVRLDVHYAPVIDLIKDQVPVREFAPLKFTCQAHARPNILSYRWFIDNNLIENATEPELLIERVTRQLHLREIKCEVKNQLDTVPAVHRLAVLYSPEYVTHLLPASLQPEPTSEPLLVPFMTNDHHLLQQHHHQRHQHQHLRHAKQQHTPSETASSSSNGPRAMAWPKRHEFELSRQLAIGFETNHNVQLRCDFDSNPRINKVIWYKVNTDYLDMRNITPSEADELIAYGAAHAIFMGQSERTLNSFSGPLPTDQHQHNKRHIVPNGEDELAPNAYHLLNEAKNFISIDYERMSKELLDEIDQLSNATTGAQMQGTTLERIISEPLTPTSARIRESLAWSMKTVPAQATQPLVAGGPGQQQQTSMLPEMAQTNRLSLIGTNEIASNSNHNISTDNDKLNEREAQIASSFITLNNANNDSIGKYICIAKSADGSHEMARAVFLVMRQAPRIISIGKQFADLHHRQIQVECLVQINTVIDNVTTITWSKNGKPIDVMRRDLQAGGNSEKNITIIEQRSPDFMFARSILVISGAEIHDFGVFYCTASTSMGPADSMPINLQQYMPTGLPFDVMATLAICSIGLLVCVVGVVIIFAPQRKLDPKKVSMSAQAGATMAATTLGAHGNNRAPGADSENCSQQSDRKSPQSLGSQDDEGRVAGAQIDSDQQNCDNELADCQLQHHRRQLQRQYHQAAQTAANSMMMSDQLNHNHQQKQDDLSLAAAARPSASQLMACADSVGAISSFGGHQQHFAHGLQSSLKHPPIRQPNHKFATIRESLEHHLSVLQPPHPPLTAPRAPPNVNGVKQTQAQQINVVKSLAISELEQSSLLNRLWSRLLMRPNRLSVGSSRRVKLRPIISMPVNTASKRSSSLSTSLSILEGASDVVGNGAISISKGNAVNLNHISGGHLVSSSANLIQDSTTASDGTASDGRSSSNSSSHQRENNHHEHLAAVQAANHHQQGSTSGSPQTFGYLNNGYIQQQLQLQQQQQQNGIWIQPSPSIANASNLSQHSGQNNSNGMLDCNLYVNHDISGAYHQQHLPYSALPAGLTSGGDLHRSIQVDGNVNGYASGGQPLPAAATWTDHQMVGVASNEHYQHPHLRLNQCYPFSSQQHSSRYSKPTVQQHFVTNNNNYSTLPMRPSSVQCHQMVSTNDDGDALFESNYGTLLSKSSAYKILGYAASSSNNSASLTAMHGGQNNLNGSLSSSSPNSMTTHAASNHPINLNGHDHPTQKKVQVPKGDEFHLQQQQQQQFDDNVVVVATTTANGNNNIGTSNQVTVVQSNGLIITTATATENLNDDGLATHV